MEYGVSSDVFAPAIVSLAVTAIGRMHAPPPSVLSGTDRNPEKSRRDVYFDGAWHPSIVYDGHALKVGTRIAGPSIVEYDHACAVLPPNVSAQADEYGNLIIDLG
jgi:N-methylhydantoinase A